MENEEMDTDSLLREERVLCRKKIKILFYDL